MHLFLFSCFFVESFGGQGRRGGSCCVVIMVHVQLFFWSFGAARSPLLGGERGSCQMYHTKVFTKFPSVSVNYIPRKYQAIPYQNTNSGYNSKKGIFLCQKLICFYVFMFLLQCHNKGIHKPKKFAQSACRSSYVFLKPRRCCLGACMHGRWVRCRAWYYLLESFC